MIDWFLAILNKPFSELTLLDLLKVAGAFMGAAVLVVLFITLLSTKPKE